MITALYGTYERMDLPWIGHYVILEQLRSIWKNVKNNIIVYYRKISEARREQRRTDVSACRVCFASVEFDLCFPLSLCEGT